MGLRWYDQKKIPKIKYFNRQCTEIIQIVDKYEIVNLNTCNLHRKMDYLLALCLNALMVTVLPMTLAALGYPYPSLFICFKSAKKLSDASVKTLLVLYVLPCAIEYKYNLVEITCIIASHIWTGTPQIYLSQSTEGKSLNFIPFIRNLCMSYKYSMHSSAHSPCSLQALNQLHFSCIKVAVFL